jgi:5'-nucleotidase
VPKSEILGVEITRQGMANFAECFDKRVDPRKRVYYWMDGQKEDVYTGDDVDDEVIKKNKISITPVKYDLTNYEFMNELKSWNVEI